MMISTRRKLAERLYAMILGDDLKPGERIAAERELAQRVGVSRTSARESLIVLETLGLIEIRGKEGMFLTEKHTDCLKSSLDLLSTWPTEALCQASETRILLEPPAAGMAATKRSDKDLQRLSDCLHELELIGTEKTDGYRVRGNVWNNQFHRLVIAAAHNQVLLRVHESISEFIDRVGGPLGLNVLLTPDVDWQRRLVSEHRAILEAIRAGSSSTAERLMQAHLLFTAGERERFYAEKLKEVGNPMVREDFHLQDEDNFLKEV